MPHCLHDVNASPHVRCNHFYVGGRRLHRAELTAPRASQLKPHQLWFQGPNRKPEQALCVSASLQTTAAKHSSKPRKSCSYDVIVLGNLCLDIFVSVPELPSREESSRRKLLQDLTASPPDRSAWEVGGNTNFMIAAARLGMQVAPVGHLGPDEYGQFIKDVLKVCSVLCTQILLVGVRRKC